MVEQSRIPSVSVVIPSFNRGHCIESCLRSVLAQTYQDFEIIVVDDASRDDTRVRMMALANSRIRYIAHEVNRGGAAARNTGIHAARGEFVAFLDSDDEWKAGKLQKQVDILRSKGEAYGFCYTWFIAHSPQKEELWRMRTDIDGRAIEDLLIENCIGTFSSVVARRSALLAVGGLDERMRSCQDWDLFVRMNAVTAVCGVHEYLVLYQQDRGDKYRISANPKSLILGNRRMLEKMQGRFPEMSSEAQVASLKKFSNSFVLAGSIPDALKTVLSIVGIAPSIRNVALIMWTLARVLKRNLTRNLGY
jgi:glycosyltransferase involved in cell wall biosynthesis